MLYEPERQFSHEREMDLDESRYATNWEILITLWQLILGPFVAYAALVYISNLGSQ